MRQHGVNRARRYSGKEQRSAHGKQAVGILPGRLGNNAGPETVFHQPAPEECRGKRGMINVRVARDQQNVQLLPAKELHFFAGHGQELGLPVAGGRFFQSADSRVPRVRGRLFHGALSWRK